MCSINPVLSEEYWVVFTASTHTSWMVRAQRAPFQHVYAVKKSEGGKFWIKIDPRSAATEVSTYIVSEYPHIRCLVNDSDVVLKVKTKIRTGERWTLCVINCVEIVKSLLGIRSFWTFTPWQLYKYIIDRGEQHGR